MFGESLLNDARAIVRNAFLRRLGRMDAWCNEAMERIERCTTIQQIEEALAFRRQHGDTVERRVAAWEALIDIDRLVEKVAGEMRLSRRDTHGT